MLDYFKANKGDILYKHYMTFDVRYVIIDYNLEGVYTIDLNETNTKLRNVIYFTYKDLDERGLVKE